MSWSYRDKFAHGEDTEAPADVDEAAAIAAQDAEDAEDQEHDQ